MDFSVERGKEAWPDLEGDEGAALSLVLGFLTFLFNFESKGGIVKSPQRCSRIVFMKRGCALDKIFFGPLFLNFLDPPLITALGNFPTSLSKLCITE